MPNFGAKRFDLTDASGSTPTIPAGQKREIILRNGGSSTVWFAFNEDAQANLGLYLLKDEVMVLDKRSDKSQMDIYMVTGSGEISSVYAQVTM